jgi:hypothetical protein
MSVFIVKVITTGQNVLFFTGAAGQGWISENITEAFEYSARAAVRKVAELQTMYAGVGLRFEAAEKPNDVYFELLDNAGDTVGGRGAKGGLTGALRRQIADDLAEKHGYRWGEGFIQVRDAKTWEVIEKMELPA